MLKTFALLATVAVTIGLSMFAISTFVISPSSYTGEVEQITIGNAQSFECDTLVYIAANKGYFAQNGLQVNIENYTSGLAAVNDLLKGKVDIAATAEFPLVRKAFDGESISAIGCIGKFQLQDLIGRRDHGINNVSDLAQKKIGVALGTISEFYIGRFLQLNGMNLQDVTLVNVNPAESVNSIVNGTIDALVIWQPYAYSAEELLGNNAVVWSVQSSQRLFILEVAKNEWISQHPDLVERFLKSLSQSEDYYVQHSTEATTMMQQNLNYTDAYMAAIWDKNEYSLSFEHALVLAMEDEARWMINNNLINATALPNFRDYIYLDGVEATKPESVSIVR